MVILVFAEPGLTKIRFDKRIRTIIMKPITCLILISFIIINFPGCGELEYVKNESNGIGSATFQIKLSGEYSDYAETAVAARILSDSCTETEVLTVEIEVRDESNSYLTSATFACSAGAGSVKNIKVGSNRTFIVKGLMSDGSEIYRGTKSGVNISEGVNDIGVITVERLENNSPAANITSSVNNSSYIEGDTISLAGTGTDMEDGTLSESSLVWTSDLDGQIGTGTSVSFTNLSVGTHTIALTATDNDGASDSDTIQVNVFVLQFYTNSLGMKFSLIPAGTFMMGSPADELGRSSNETQHQVTLTQSFYLQTTEVTQGQWEAVMGSNPSIEYGVGNNYPVHSVSWDEVQNFITTLNGMGIGTYRTPTEAEWEYACRAGSNTAFTNGGITEYSDMYECNYDANLDAMGWHCNDGSSVCEVVAQKTSNAWGLYDMHGNIWEWCSDWYGTYPSGSATDPTGPSLLGGSRVLRGGGWFSNPSSCRSANRDHSTLNGSYFIGLRLVRTP